MDLKAKDHTLSEAPYVRRVEEDLSAIGLESERVRLERRDSCSCRKPPKGMMQPLA